MTAQYHFPMVKISSLKVTGCWALRDGAAEEVFSMELGELVVTSPVSGSMGPNVRDSGNARIYG
jgi:hypothetical protein